MQLFGQTPETALLSALAAIEFYNNQLQVSTELRYKNIQTTVEPAAPPLDALMLRAAGSKACGAVTHYERVGIFISQKLVCRSSAISSSSS
jgi:hypothetical protein